MNKLTKEKNMNEVKAIVSQGTFSKLTIALDSGVVNKLALIDKDSNPLAKAEKALKKAHHQFEKEYFKLNEV